MESIDDSSENSEEAKVEKKDVDWEEECYVCKKDGIVMCCETCPKVCHFECTNLKYKPRGDWYCDYCVAHKRTGRKYR
jgi:hypothetical protein